MSDSPNGSALLKVIDYIDASTDPKVKALGDQARSELYTILEMDTNEVVDPDARLNKEIRDYFYHTADNAGTVGFMIAAEIVLPNSNTMIATRFGGSFMMPWNRMGMLQYVTNHEMTHTLGGSDDDGE